MATLPLKASHNEQRSELLGLWTNLGWKCYCNLHAVQTWPQWLSSFWANEENAKWAEICIWYWNAINCSLVA